MPGCAFRPKLWTEKYHNHLAFDGIGSRARQKTNTTWYSLFSEQDQRSSLKGDANTVISLLSMILLIEVLMLISSLTKAHSSFRSRNLH